MIDRKIKIVETLEAKLKEIRRANGYNLNMTVYEGCDWLTTDQIDKAELPASLVSAEGLENYTPEGNVPHTAMVDIPVYIWMETSEVRGENRTTAREMVNTVKTALKCCDIQMELNRLGYAKNFYLKNIITYTGWAEGLVMLVFLYKAEYSEEDEWLI